MILQRIVMNKHWKTITFVWNTNIEITQATLSQHDTNTRLLGTLPNWGWSDVFQNKSEWRLQIEEKTVWAFKNFQHFFKKKKSVRGKVGCVKSYLNRKEVCDLAVQKAFRALITGVRKQFPPGGVVMVL